MGNSKFVSAVYAPPTMTYCPLMIIVTSWDAYKVDLTMSLYHISCFYSDFRSFHNGLGNQTEGLLMNSIPSSLPNIDFSIIKSFLELGWRSYLVRWQRTRTLSTGIIWKPSRNGKLIFSWQNVVKIRSHKPTQANSFRGYVSHFDFCYALQSIFTLWPWFWTFHKVVTGQKYRPSAFFWC